MSQQKLIEQVLAERELARRSLIHFMRYTFKYIYKKPFDENWHHGYLAEILEGVYAGQIRRLLLNMPPNYGKTEQAVRQFAPWSMGKDPQRKHIYATYGADLSEQVSVQTRNIVAHPAYGGVFPDTKLAKEQNQKHYWTTTEGGGFYATGSGGAVTGFHGHTILVDDLMKAIDARSRAARDEAWAYLRGSLISRLQDKKAGAIVVIMQRLHPDDPTGRIIADEEMFADYEHICLRGFEDAPITYHYGGFIYERKAGEPLFEAREGIEELARAKREMGLSDFQAQYQQDPETIEAGFFTDEMLSREMGPAELPPLNLLIMVDPAMSLNQESDDRTIEVQGWGMMNDADLIVYMDGWAGKWAIQETVARIVDAMELYPEASTHIEGAGGGHAIDQLLSAEIAKRNTLRRERGLPPIRGNYSIYSPKKDMTKNQKISVMQPYFNNGQIVFRRGANDADNFKKEAKAWHPDKKHNKDNRIDAFASGWFFGTPKKMKEYRETGRIRARSGNQDKGWSF